MDCHNLGVDSCFTEDSLLGQFLHSEDQNDDILELDSIFLNNNSISMDTDIMWSKKFDLDTDYLNATSLISPTSPSPSKLSSSDLSESLSHKEQDDDSQFEALIGQEIATESNDSDNVPIDTHSPTNSLCVARTLEIHNYCSMMPPNDVSEKPSRVCGKRAPKSINSSDLKLTEEEKKLLIKEGYELPAGKKQLSAQDEKVLRKIRRKIRNKRSAQFSRQRKKIYVEELEKKFKECKDENKDLKKEVEELKRENQSLLSKMRKILQDYQSHGQVSFRTSLCVLILSFLFILIPAFRPESLEDPFGKNQPEIMNTGRHLLMSITGHETANDTINKRDPDLLPYIDQMSLHTPNIPLNL